MLNLKKDLRYFRALLEIKEKCYLNDKLSVLTFSVILLFLQPLVKLLDKSRDGKLLFPRLE